jgi:hypothetical protein
MAAFCPALRYAPAPGGAGGWWSGPITPIRSTERVLDLLDDIHHHRPVYTISGGELCHLLSCRESHCRHPWMERIRPEDLVRTFDARLYYSGGHDDPRCWITGIDLTNGRHMWSDGSICPFLSSLVVQNELGLDGRHRGGFHEPRVRVACVVDSLPADRDLDRGRACKHGRLSPGRHQTERPVLVPVWEEVPKVPPPAGPGLRAAGEIGRWLMQLSVMANWWGPVLFAIHTPMCYDSGNNNFAILH